MDFEGQAVTTIEKPKEPGIPKEILDMYVVPGYEESYTEHSLQRYRRESEKLKLEMIEAGEVQPENLLKDEVDIIPLLWNAENKDLPNILYKGFATRNYEVIRACANAIIRTDINLQPGLRKALAESLYAGFYTGNPDDMSACAESIFFLEEEDQEKFRKILAQRIHKAFDAKNYLFMKAIALSLYSLEKNDRDDLKKILTEHIKSGFNTSNPDVILLCSKALGSTETSDQRAVFIRQGFTTKIPAVVLQCAKFVTYTEESEQIDLNNLFSGILQESFSLNNAKLLLACAEAIQYLAKEKRSDLQKILVAYINQGFNSDNPERKRLCMRIIPFISEREQRGLYELASKNTGAIFVEGMLYGKMSEGFSREAFEKNGGAETTLLGNFSGSDLKWKSIVRHFKQTYFLEWKKLYDDHAFWKQNGFDYVPIEPIVSFSPRKSGMIDVYTGVLDLSLRDWSKRSDLWVGELRDDQKKLMSILSEIGYDHGHYDQRNGFSHDGNFCLRFFRNKDGSIDYSKKPRIYLIDFDQAVSEKKTA